MTQPSANAHTMEGGHATKLPQGNENQYAAVTVGTITAAAMGSPSAAALTDQAGGGAAVNGTIEEIEDSAISTAGGNTYADAAAKAEGDAIVDDIANAAEELIAEYNNAVLDVALMKTDVDKGVTDVTAAFVIANAGLTMLQAHGLIAGGTQPRKGDTKLAYKNGAGWLAAEITTSIADVASLTSGAVGALNGAAITDSGGGTNNATISVQTDLTFNTSYSDTDFNTEMNAWVTEASNAVKSLSTSINAFTVDIAACKAEFNKTRTDAATFKAPHDAMLNTLEYHGLKSGGTKANLQQWKFSDGQQQSATDKTNRTGQLGYRQSAPSDPAAVSAAAVTATNIIVVDTSIGGSATPDGTVEVLADYADPATGDTWGTGSENNTSVAACIDDAANTFEEIAAKCILMNADVADCIVQTNALRTDYTTLRTYIVAALDALQMVGLVAG